ncbi:hypothetical protein DSAG12_00970 [Promethearchaeum syntrophicum]|uniref:Uncharacterized protein n=1 Tax=Promethearchaeum syntrophicum TaxID=2594042 RepID=A0A5B9D8E3_9ARCH|nr:hypothetical protein [Candidatus Prometheoarchaeum syntrophicum]QEE15147.1 hypothetical protein DSAG12_00970 [Candidatus Prometheoarchaeum syntrophicum]
MTKKTKNYGVARTLAVLGGIIAIAGFIWGLITVVTNGGNFESIFLNIAIQIIGIIVSIFVLISTGFIRKDKKSHIPFNWWMLLIFVLIQAWMTYYTTFMGLATLGIILESVAVILLLIDVL